MSKRTDDTSQKPPVERSVEQYESATVSSDLQTRPLAVVTGASTGIGYELAKCCAKGGFELLIAADEPAIHQAAATFRTCGVEVEAVEADLATIEGVETFYASLNGRAIDALVANAGRG